MYRYKFVIEYSGTASEVGWQHQPNKVSIQSILQEAAYKFCQENISFYGASRTDKGVHALHQVAHADFSKSYPVTTIKKALNFHLSVISGQVAISEVKFVHSEFHARFDAKIKTYRYDLCIRDCPNVLNKNNWRLISLPNLEEMQAAAKLLIGQHDFASFRDSQCQAKSSIRTISDIHFSINGNMISIFFVGQSFLHHQVRIMVGTLIDIGKGRKEINDIITILDSKDRNFAGPTAPPNGLFLEKIEFVSG
ncbi:MAG: tRNA pseudouridine(38-40) synthase TruA [Alphaproteobacteria bacterium]|nr:MAG: tRNA pseudouridine(38-40) synthase TruA [Alphaproteobacteria bacterium]